MFTGIVQGVGEVSDVADDPDGRRLRIETDAVGDLTRGASVAVDGVCLTVEAFDDDGFEVFTAAETLDRTTLDAAAAGDRVNVERALRADGHLDGHFVQGHVDATAAVRDVEQIGEDYRYTVSVPEGYVRYLVEKGSVAVDGVSLTVASLDRDAGTFDVAVVPETYAVTTLDGWSAGDRVNLEVDVLAKYVESLLAE